MRIPKSLTTVAIALYALASVLVGIAHAIADPGRSAAAASSQPSLDGYRLPDGSLPVLCLTDRDGGEPASQRPVCDACLVSSAHALPPAGPAGDAIEERAQARAAPSAPRPAVAARCGANRARAPPATRLG